MEFVLGDDVIKVDIKRTKINKDIKDAITSLPDFRKRKMDISLLNFVMNMLENLVKKKYCLSKKDMLLEVYNEAFGKLSDDELTAISKNIEYLLKSGSIKQFSSLYKIWIAFKRYFRC
jgi:predicted CopG family antitoxin